MSEGSVQGDSNNDKLMVSTKCLFDLFRFSLMPCQRAKPFLYLLGYLSNAYHLEASTLVYINNQKIHHDIMMHKKSK